MLPIQIVVGVCGNALNLLVLLSKYMRSATNILLASVALFDCLFLVTSSVSVIRAHTRFSTNKTAFTLAFEEFYLCNYHRKAPILNFFSAASIWLVSFYSFIAITTPKWCCSNYEMISQRILEFQADIDGDGGETIRDTVAVKGQVFLEA